MKWRSARRSSNVQDIRGRRGGGGMKLGLGGVAAVVVIGLLLGKNPMELLGLVNQVQQQMPAGPAGQGDAPPVNDEASQFVASILGETEDVWGAIFEASGSQYTPAQLVLFSGQVQSACGGASAAVGPFYCPADQKVYIDLSFFDQMERRLGGGGDFAEAYVIAHEVGHHVQTLTGISGRVNAIRQRGGNVEGAEGPLVRQELQADCYAGLWAHHAQRRHAWLEDGDLEEAMNTATAIGDDTLQRQGQGQVVPDSFTHGSAAQRVRWFRIGFESGDVGRCDTFAASQL
ncbi:neutral zinc metallopeptidase [Arenimonas sp.]|uniref:KPN_02809 family neutral zinc metallopeptidase n=1 Tax=Arenimonas sp. TaxID=1872635 RepID=UPI0035AE41B8